MKFKSLLFAAAFAGLFSACSNEIDEIVSDNDNKQTEQGGEAYASFSFLMPNAGLTRATETEVGTSVENQITNVGVYMFKDNVLDKTITMDRASFSPDIVGGATLYTTKKPQEVNEGTFKVYVIVNPTSKLAVTAGTSLSDFQGYVEKVAITTGEYCTDNKFMMTNATQIVETTITKANNIKNPALASVKVERIAAKITFTNNNAEYPIKDANDANVAIGSVKFDAYKIINTRNSAYNLRRVGNAAGDVSAIGGDEVTGNYVIENFFTQKTETFATSVYAPNYSRKYDTYVAFRGLNETGSQTLAYALENTMRKEAQLTGYSTAAIFRAQVTLNTTNVTGEVKASKDIYRYANKFYASLTDLVKGLNPNFTTTEDKTVAGLDKDILGIKAGIAEKGSLTEYFKSINDITTLKTKFGVDYFVGGKCYYTTWFRHNNDTKADEMGIMEYVMVRNNVYKLSINSVNMIGEISSGTPGPQDPTKPLTPGVDEPETGTNPEIPGEIVPNPEPTNPVIPFDPTQPIVSAKTYLNMSIEVLRWTVRDNELDL